MSLVLLKEEDGKIYEVVEKCEVTEAEIQERLAQAEQHVTNLKLMLATFNDLNNASDEPAAVAPEVAPAETPKSEEPAPAAPQEAPAPAPEPAPQANIVPADQPAPAPAEPQTPAPEVLPQ